MQAANQFKDRFLSAVFKKTNADLSKTHDRERARGYVKWFVETIAPDPALKAEYQRHLASFHFMNFEEVVAQNVRPGQIVQLKSPANGRIAISVVAVEHC